RRPSLHELPDRARRGMGLNAGCGGGPFAAGSVLVGRAHALLSKGTSDAVTLVEHVFQQSGTPAAVAEHLAWTLLGAQAAFVRDSSGRWALASAAAQQSTGVQPANGDFL